MPSQKHASNSTRSGQERSSRSHPAGDPPLEELEIGMSKYLTRLTDKFRNRKVWERPEPCKVLAFIPGTIQKIMVEEGMEVHEKTPLLILEAMKMYNELLSPQHGVIEKIHVAEGDRVAKGHLLLEFRQV